MQVTLVALLDKKRTREIPLTGTEVILGRAKTCDVRIAAHEVSRKHCRLLIQGSSVSVRDLGSSNGTYLNGQPVTGERLLKPGDKLQLGRVSFRVDFDPATEALDALPVESDLKNLPLASVSESAVPEIPPLEVGTTKEQPIEDLPIADFDFGDTSGLRPTKRP